MTMHLPCNTAMPSVLDDDSDVVLLRERERLLNVARAGCFDHVDWQGTEITPLIPGGNIAMDASSVGVDWVTAFG